MGPEQQGLAERIAGREILLADGAMGSMLLQRGLEPGACPEAINLTQPEILEEIAALYLEAGADILETNTFGGSPVALARYGLADQTEAIKSATEKLNAVWQEVAQRMYQSASAEQAQQQATGTEGAAGEAGAGAGEPKGPGGGDDDKVVDADYEILDDDKKE